METLESPTPGSKRALDFIHQIIAFTLDRGMDQGKDYRIFASNLDVESDFYYVELNIYGYNGNSNISLDDLYNLVENAKPDQIPEDHLDDLNSIPYNSYSVYRHDLENNSYYATTRIKLVFYK